MFKYCLKPRVQQTRNYPRSFVLVELILEKNIMVLEIMHLFEVI